jgi:Resolvase, N terminal domain
LEAFCQTKGYSRIRLFVELQSGAKVTRPQLEAMLAEVRSCKVEQVVVYKLERLGRSRSHLALILDELRRIGILCTKPSQSIHPSAGQSDATDPTGYLHRADFRSAGGLEDDTSTIPWIRRQALKQVPIAAFTAMGFSWPLESSTA